MKAATQPGARYEALLELLRTSEALWNASRLFFARWDLSPSQFNILNLLYEAAEGWNQVELSRHLIMHRSNITGLVDRLEERGLVRRRSAGNDRRSNRVVITREGLGLVRKILPHYYTNAEAVWAGIPPVRVAAMVQQFTLLRRNLEGIAATAAPPET